MKKILPGLLLLLFLIPLVGHAANWFEGSFDAAKAKAHQENKLILVDFYSDG